MNASSEGSGGGVAARCARPHTMHGTLLPPMSAPILTSSSDQHYWQECRHSSLAGLCVLGKTAG